MLIEADKSVDEDTKQFNKFKMDIISEYESIINKISQVNEYDMNEVWINKIISSLSERFEHNVNNIYNRCILQQIQNAVIHWNSIYERNINKEIYQKIEVVDKSTPIDLSEFSLDFEESIKLEHHINNSLLNQIVLLRQNSQNESCLSER